MASIARILAEGKVRLSIDGTGLRREIQAAIKEAVAGVRETIQVTADTQQVQRSVTDATRNVRATVKIDADKKHLQRSLEGLAKFSGGVLSNMVSGSLLAAGVRGFVQYGAAIAAVLPALASLAQGLLTASQALALIPAVAVAGIATLSTLAIGLKGVGEALKNVGDAEKFNKALENLSPNARDFAKSIKSLVPDFRKLRLGVQDKLFAGLDKTITNLAKSNLPTLRRGLGGISTELNRGFRMWADWASEASTVKDTGKILNNTRGALKQLAPAGRDVAAALTDIVTVGSEFLPGLAKGAKESAAEFRKFIRDARESGQLKKFIREGITAFGDMVATIRNLGSIVGTVFGGLSKDGDGFFATTRRITGGWKEFLKSVEGQVALDKMARAIQSIGGPLRTLITEGFRKLGPAFEAALPFMEEFARVLSSVIREAIDVVAPILKDLFTFISENKGWLAPLIVGIFAFLKVAVVFRSAIKGIMILLGGMRTLAGLAALALGKGGKGGLAGGIAGAGVAAGGAAKGGLRAFVGRLGFVGAAYLALTHEFEGGKGVIETTGAAFDLLGAAVTGNDKAISRIKQEFGPALRDMKDTMQVLSPVTSDWARFLSPIGALLRETAGGTETLVKDGRPLLEYFRNARAVAEKFGQGSKHVFRLVGVDVQRLGGQLRERSAFEAWARQFGIATGSSKKFLRGVETVAKSVFSGIRTATGLATGDIADKTRSGSRSAARALTSIQSGWKGVTAGITSTARDTFQSKLPSAVRSGAAPAAGAARSIGEAIRRAANPGDLSSVGRAAGNSIAAGIQQAIGGIRSASRGMAGAIRGVFGFSPAKYGPLAGSGYPLLLGRAIPRMVARGIQQGRGGLDRASRDMAQSIRDYLPSSPAKKGPLKGKGYPLFAGKEIVESLIRGIRGSARDAETEMKRLISRLWKSKRSALVGRVTGAFLGRGGILSDLIPRRDQLTRMIKDAQAAFDRIVQMRSDLRQAMRDSTLEGRDLFGSMFGDLAPEGSAATAGDIRKRLDDNLAAIRRWQDDLRALVKKGFSRDLVAQIAAAGPEAGAAMADALAAASPLQVKQINGTFKTIGDTASAFAKEISGKLFNAGVRAADGLLKGLERRRSAIQALINRIARDLIASIKKALGIKSPSREFMRIGELTADGLLKGLERGFGPVVEAVETLGDELVSSLVASTTIPPIAADLFTGRTAPGTGPGSPPLIMHQTNVMRPGSDIRQFADQVLQRGASDLLSGAGTLAVSRSAVQRGVNDQMINGVLR